MGLLGWFRRKGPRIDPERELLRLVRRAKKEIQSGPRASSYDVARMVEGLEELEQALGEGGASQELLRSVEQVIGPFVPRPMSAAGRPDVPARRESTLIQLSNKLKELRGAKEGGSNG